MVFLNYPGAVKSLDKDLLKEAGRCCITALTDPQIRKLPKQGTPQMDSFEEKVCEVVAAH